MRAKRSVYNLITSISSQLIILLLGLAVPRLILVGYGSETNGFMSLVSQIYAYIALLEAGLCGAEIQALYGPVTRKDYGGISSVVNTAQRYYRNLTYSYAVVILVVALALPVVVKSELHPAIMVGYFLLFGISRLINFWFVASMRPLLQVEGKNYINTGIDFVFNLCSTLIRILLLLAGTSLLLLQVAYCVINILQILVYFLYFHRKYSWLDRAAPINKECLQQRSAYLLQQISQLVFSCTDTILLSVFCDLKTTSIYAVYMLVINALSMLVYKFASSTQFVLGQIFHENHERYLSVHRAYEVGLMTVSVVLYATAYIMILPFIKLYTAGVTDAGYLDAMLPLLFCVNEILSVSKFVPLNLVNVAGHARKIVRQTIGEVVINLGVSLLLVRVMGIRGVLIGTMIALAYRLIALVAYANRSILQVSNQFETRMLLSNLVLFGVIAVVFRYLHFDVGNYGQFVVVGFGVFALMGFLFGGVNYLAHRKLLRPNMQRIIGRLVRRKFS